jgi:hypothetical protein
VLGFETDRTAQRYIQITNQYGANATRVSDLESDRAIEISRQLWGHTNNKKPREIMVVEVGGKRGGSVYA